jgi:hypothetical protein
LVGSTAVREALSEHLEHALEVAGELLSGRAEDEQLARGRKISIGFRRGILKLFQRLGELQDSLRNA